VSCQRREICVPRLRRYSRNWMHYWRCTNRSCRTRKNIITPSRHPGNETTRVLPGTPGTQVPGYGYLVPGYISLLWWPPYHTSRICMYVCAGTLIYSRVYSYPGMHILVSGYPYPAGTNLGIRIVPGYPDTRYPYPGTVSGYGYPGTRVSGYPGTVPGTRVSGYPGIRIPVCCSAYTPYGYSSSIF